MSEPYSIRGLTLLRLGRHAEAASEFQKALGEEPNDADTHAFLATCLLNLEKYDDATKAAERAVGLEPDSDFAHFTLARAWYGRNHHDRASASIDEAIRLRPDDASNYGLKASILFAERQWQAALDAAETGLQFDAEHSDCNNMRAMALVKLGRRAEATENMDAVLARNPEDSFSHANMGWAKLESRDVRAAMEHFREALRLDPNNEYARQGIVEALKARNPLYRVMLTLGLWMIRLPKSTQIGIIVGSLVVYQLLKSAANANPALAPFVTPMLTTFIVLSWCSWFAVPVFNMLLRFDRDGRRALSEEQIRESNWLIGLLALYLSLRGAALFEGFGLLRFPAMLVLGLILPISFVFDCSPGWPRRTMIAFSWVMAVIAALILGPPLIAILTGGAVKLITGAQLALLFRTYAILMLAALGLGFWLSTVTPKG